LQGLTPERLKYDQPNLACFTGLLYWPALLACFTDLLLACFTGTIAAHPVDDLLRRMAHCRPQLRVSRAHPAA
jgi:hypothetical protein